MAHKPDVVISGLSGRFPMSDDLEEFKQNLFAGVDMVTADDIRWPVGYLRLPSRNGKVFSMDQFDSKFFGETAEEAELMDPQDRLLLETAYEALLDAGVDPKSLRGSNTGYFHGACYVEAHSDYNNPDEVPRHPKALITRIPRFFGLRGPILDVDTACGSGLSAFSEAFHSIRNGLCDQAIACASNTCFRAGISAQFRDLKMITKDGKCKCLDSSADGYVRSEAVVVVYLQKSKDAKRIYANLLACRSNSDGYKEEGITFPSVDGQIQLLNETYADAGINPGDIDYIEAHITGTKAGDPVEMNAMYDVICTKRDKPVLIGCLKSNIGHTEGSSGLCAIAKACIVYQSGMIPPNLHYNNPNLNLKGLESGKMLPVSKATKYEGKYIPVNCFGFGGANTHLITMKNEGRRDGNRDITGHLPARLVQVCGRTEAAVSYICSQLKAKPMYLTQDFLSILNDFTKHGYDNNEMVYRNYLLIAESKSEDGFTFTASKATKVGHKQKLWFNFLGSKNGLTNVQNIIKNFPATRATIEKLNVSTKVYNCDLFQSNAKDMVKVLAQNVAIQIAFVDLLKQLDIVADGFAGQSTGVLVAAYVDGCLTGEEAVTCAIKAGSLAEENWKIKEALRETIQKPQKRSSRWTNSGFELASADFFESRLLCSLDEVNCPAEAIVLEISATGLKLQSSQRSSNDSTSESLVAIGQLYQSGHCANIEQLYPAIEYPIASSTPFLSPLIHWDHTETCSIQKYLQVRNLSSWQTAKNLVYRFEKSLSVSAFMYDHKVDGRVLFPATGYLLMAWDAFAKNQRTPILEVPVTFENIKFLRATVLSDDAETALSVRLNDDTGDFEIKEGSTNIVTGRIRDVSPEDIKNIVRQESKSSLKLSAKDIYKELRVRGYDYGSYFQGLHEAEADGSEGQIIWRDIVPKQIKDTMAFETDEDNALFWLKSWVPFVDALFQLQLLQEKNSSRTLMVPTSIDQLTCLPELLVRATQHSKMADLLTHSECSLINGFCDTDLNITYCEGLMIKDFKASVLQRKKQMVKLLKYDFMPLDDENVFDPKVSKRIEQHADAIILASSQWVESKAEQNQPNDSSSLLNKFVESRNNEAEKAELSTSLDLVMNANTNMELISQQKFFKAAIDLCVYNLVASTSRHSMDILEVTTGTFLLQQLVSESLNDHLLYNQMKVTYNVLHPNPELMKEVPNIKEIIPWNDAFRRGKLPSSSIIVYQYDPKVENAGLMSTLLSSVKDGGFMIVICKAQPNDKKMLDVLQGRLQEQFVQFMSVATEAHLAGWLPISRKVADKSLPLELLLFRKTYKSPARQMEVGLADYSSWLEPLKEQLADGKKGNIWIVPKFDAKLNGAQITGLLGFVKSLRLETHGERLRCLMDWTSKSQVNITDDKYDGVISRDLVHNVLRTESEGWGSFEHVYLPDDLRQDDEAVQQTEHVYLRSLKPGDLTSLTWTTNNVTSNQKYMDSHVRIGYAPLNFKDIMFATGRLSMDAIPASVSPLQALDSLLGLEYSGIDNNDNRVMGIVPYKALATTLPITESETEFMWSVPNHWSLEDAATVPVVYATALYALIVRGKLLEGETVLIHAGSGGVGLAAINICMAKKCNVITTVGSEEKKAFLLQEFKDLKPEHVLNSRSLKFEEDVLKLTNGRGVDVVLNSLSEEKLLASLRCLAANGRFMEIGKVDFVNDNALRTQQLLDNNKSMHGVFLDTLTSYTPEDYFSKQVAADKKQLRQLMISGIADGYVKPLPRTVFERQEIEKAFRYMSKGKHIGKVLIKMNENLEGGTGNTQSQSVNVNALRTTFLNPDKSYLVVGGLGGLGLELVQWLVQKGARNVVVSSRRGLSNHYQKYVWNKLQKQGVNMVVCQADATSEEGAAVLLEQSAKVAKLGLGGIFNSAVVYQDCLFADQTVDMFEQVCAPKAQVTLFLDKLTRQHHPHLDYFVTFSSISAGRGNEGQTNYNFANSVMDSVCFSRREAGFHGLSVQWGVIGDVGLVAEIHSQEGASSAAEVVLLGAASQRVHSVFDTFDRILNYSTAACVASLVRPTQVVGAGRENADLVKIIANIIGLKDLAILDQTLSLGSLGIDSLIAVEIKQIIEQIINVNLDLKQVRELTIASLIELSTTNEVVAEVAKS